MSRNDPKGVLELEDFINLQSTVIRFEMRFIHRNKPDFEKRRRELLADKNLNEYRKFVSIHLEANSNIK